MPGNAGGLRSGPGRDRPPLRLSPGADENRAPRLAPRPRLLLDVAESDGHALILRSAGASAPSIGDLASSAGDCPYRSYTRPIQTLQDQSVTVRLSDIKEEARARRPYGRRFSSAPGDSR